MTVPNDVAILVACENNEFAQVAVKPDEKDLKETFKNEVLNKTEDGCYIHQYNFYKEMLENQVIEHNKRLSKEIQKKFGFRTKKDKWGGYHIKGDFQVRGTIKNFIGQACSWKYRFKGIATKYVQHYYCFFSL